MDKKLLQEYHEGLIALSACITGEIPKLILKNNFSEAKKAALEYQEIFGKENFYLEIGHHPGIAPTIKANEGLKKLSSETGIPLVATQDIHYVKKEDAEYHDILLAVQTGNKLSDKEMKRIVSRLRRIRKEEEGRGNKIKVALQLTVQVSNHIGTISQPDSEVLAQEVLYETARKK